MCPNKGIESATFGFTGQRPNQLSHIGQGSFGSLGLLFLGFWSLYRTLGVSVFHWVWVSLALGRCFFVSQEFPYLGALSLSPDFRLSGLSIPVSRCPCHLLWVTPAPGAPALLVPHRVAAALCAAAFGHFFLFFRLLLSSSAAGRLRRDLGSLLLAGAFGVLPGLGGSSGLNRLIALWDLWWRSPLFWAAGSPHGGGSLQRGGRGPESGGVD